MNYQIPGTQNTITQPSYIGFTQFNMKKADKSVVNPAHRFHHKIFDYTYSKMYDKMWNSHYWRQGLKKYMDVLWDNNGKIKPFETSRKTLIMVAPNAD